MGTIRSAVLAGLGLLVLTGCLAPVQQATDALICQQAAVRIDPLPSAAKTLEELPEPKGKESSSAVQQVAGLAFQQPGSEEREKMLQEKRQLFLKRLELPPNVPGAKTARVELPSNFRTLPPAEQDRVLARFFPPMPPLGLDPEPVPGPHDRPLTLEDLQRLARENSPLLRQAASDIEAAKGAAWQAGMYPNPTIGVASNAIGPNGGPLMGPYLQQTIKSFGKLKLAQGVALMDVANAEAAYRKAETDLMTSVRTAYFQVLTAEASIKANHALADLTHEVYKLMLVQMKSGLFATYEPMQVAVFAAQARIALVQSRTAYLTAWKQLGSALGLPAMPPTQLAGSVEHRLPRFDFEKVLARVLATHTDVITANNGIQKQRYNLRLSEVTAIPDVTVGATLMYDATPPGPPRWVTFFTGNMPIPVWDRNQGGIKQAQGQLLHAIQEPRRVRAALTASVADAYNRAETNRILLEMYMRHMLPQQVSAFRATVLRHAGAVDVAFSDLIQAEQALVGIIPTYLTTLGAYWQAVADLAGLLQTDDVYRVAEEVDEAPLPDLVELLKLPDCPPCSSLPPGTFQGISPFASPPGRPVAPPTRNVPADAAMVTQPAVGIAAPVALPALGPIVPR